VPEEVIRKITAAAIVSGQATSGRAALACTSTAIVRLRQSAKISAARHQSGTHFTMTENLKKILWATILRGALLPRPISGQSRLPEAEAALADTVIA
jgi:hypothetical protein